ncbi:MAG: YrbL family protein [Marinobacter sp.]|uniref:YrbL family protein n=1 Tax=Marinobacter sp. TaxID=50741 RepID=UPI0034A044B9
MIDLTHSVPFASGSNRHCFQHPDDPQHCLKIVRPENIEARFQRQTWLKKTLGKERLNDNRQEQIAHQQSVIRHLLETRQETLIWAHLPKFYGTRNTTLGPANESQLILDSSGEPAITLETHLQHYGFGAPTRAAVTRFCEWLSTTGILTRNLLPHNLVVSDHQEELTLFLVDGLGAPLIPESLAILPAWRARYIARRIQRFYLRIEWELGDRRNSWEVSQKL